MGRRLGQHFLRDHNILDRIVDALDPRADDAVLEIGTGQGTLTRRLLGRVGRVVGIEKDADLLERTRAVCDEDGLRGRISLVEGDALELDWHETVGAAGAHAVDPFKVIGNIPYYITSPLIEKALTPPRPAVIVFLVQKEVADRVAAVPGNKTYGALTVGVQLAARAERLFVVRAGAFDPPPDVDSAVLRLVPHRRPLIEDADATSLRRFVVALFSQRRKRLARSLRDAADCTREQAEAVLAAASVSPDARPEVLAPEQFVTLFRGLMR